MNLGREQKVWLGKRCFHLSRYEMRLLFDWLDWAGEQIKDPFLPLLERWDSCPVDLQARMTTYAIKAYQLRKSLASPDVQELSISLDGKLKVLEVLLERCKNPAKVARHLYAHYGAGQLDRWIDKAQGRVPPQKQSEGQMTFLARKPEDWWSIFHQLMYNLHYTPKQLLEMTLTEVSIIFDEPNHDEEKSDLVAFLLAKEQVEKTQSLTPLQRIEKAYIDFQY